MNTRLNKSVFIDQGKTHCDLCGMDTAKLYRVLPNRYWSELIDVCEQCLNKFYKNKKDFVHICL